MQSIKLGIMLSAGLFMSACSTTYDLVKPPHIYTTENPYPHSAVAPASQSPTNRIIYVTDRMPEVTKTGEPTFGTERSRQVRFGVASVRIGEDETWSDLVATANSDIPRVKLKAAVSGLTAVGDFPTTPMQFSVQNGRVVMNPNAMSDLRKSRDSLASLIRGQMDMTQSREVIIYIHGYKTGFDEALLTLNDIHHYSGRHGVPIAYTWPSNDGNSLFGYFRDQASAEFTIFHLKEFLRTVMDMEDVPRIHIVAHSLGTDVTTTALRELLIETRASGQNPRETLKVENLIMAAPDLDYGLVTQRLISERFGPAFGRITVYTNEGDRALSLSNMFYSGIRFGKLIPGQEKPQEVEIFNNVRNVNFVSVEGGSDGFFNHGYFNKDPATLSDIITLITNPADPGSKERPLNKLDGNFWEMKSDYLQTSELTSSTDSPHN